MKYSKDTRDRILEAAYIEFQEKGYNGTRMQSIADLAGINKALLHYYYKSKEALFQIVIKRAISLFLPGQLEIFSHEEDFYLGLQQFVSGYIDFLMKHPKIPGFITQEINSNPEKIVQLFREGGHDLDPVKQRIQVAIDDGIINPVSPEQLIVNTIALAVFPFIAKPLIKSLVIDDTEKQWKKLMEERKTMVAEFIFNAIKK
jgi:AcrR family transcriptional regulator